MSANTGWICPRCSDVNGPMVQKCGCNAYYSKFAVPHRPPYKVDDTEMFKVHPETTQYNPTTVVYPKDLWNV